MFVHFYGFNNDCVVTKKLYSDITFFNIMHAIYAHKLSKIYILTCMLTLCTFRNYLKDKIRVRLDILKRQGSLNNNHTVEEATQAYYDTLNGNRISDVSFTTHKEAASILSSKQANDKHLKEEVHASHLQSRHEEIVEKENNSETCNSYVNASFVASCSELDGFVVVQHPHSSFNREEVYNYAVNVLGNKDVNDVNIQSTRVTKSTTRSKAKTVGRSVSVNEIYNSTDCEPDKTITGNVYNTLQIVRSGNTDSNYDVSILKSKPKIQNVNYNKVTIQQ